MSIASDSAAISLSAASICTGASRSAELSRPRVSRCCLISAARFGQQPAIGFAESALNGSAGNIAPREGAQLRINGGKLRIHRVTSSGIIGIDPLSACAATAFAGKGA